MAVNIFTEESMVDCLHYPFKDARAVRGKIENYRQGQERKGEIDVLEAQGNGDKRADDGHHGADRAPADFPFADFRILDMRGKKHISPHPIQRKSGQDDVHAEDYDRHLIFIILSEQASGKGHQAYQHEKQRVDIGEHRVHVFCVNRDKKVMRAPVGEKQGKTEHIT